ncbi:MAG TPA: EamA family transporter [Acidimicrobiia bacterium]|nr:EamA family transporter [Acidimicrobiia bacterium]
MMGTVARPGAFTLAAFAGVVILGGGNFLAVRVSNGELAPFWGAGLRFSLAALIFVVMAASMRLTIPRGKTLALTALYGFFVVTLSYALMYWALTRVTAGTGAVVLAMVPLVTALLAASQRLERLNSRTLLGALIAFGGIVWMTVGADGLVIPLDGLVAILAASFTIAQSVILGKHVSGNHPVITNAVGMGIGAPLLLVLSAIVGEPWAVPSQAATVAAVSYLVLLGSVGLFVLTLLVVRYWTASAMSYAFVLFPVVTMLAEAWLLDEPLTARSAIGAVAVMAGVWFGALSPARKKPSPEAVAAARAS